MKPVKFREANLLLTSKDVENLPCCRTPEYIISCWKISFYERIKMLFTGKVWFLVKSRMHPPITLTTNRPFED